MPKATQLVVWTNGAKVGVWSQPRSGAPSFQYDPVWIGLPAGRPLSLSLPFTPANEPHRGATVTNFFDNLLPDSDEIRTRIRSRYATDSAGAFDLLTAIGRDCVGAVQLLPEGDSPRGFDRIDADPLDQGGVEQAIGAALSGSRVLGQAGSEDFRISLAGTQEKTALLYYDHRWWRPRGATPTTHILKLPLGMIGNLQADMRDSVENEWLCTRLLQAFGLETAHCEIAHFGSRKVLVVQRFDRAWQNDRWIARLPQEDFCQALGLPSRLRYESDGGPGMGDILRILTASSRAQADMRAFLKAQMVFWLLAATDGHAKNFSIFHERGGTYRLAPFYDVLSAWPIIGNRRNEIPWQKVKLAMAVRGKNAHWKPKDIRPRHWDALARLAGMGDASSLVSELVSQVPEVIAKMGGQLRGFPSHVSNRIIAGMEMQVSRLAGEA